MLYTIECYLQGDVTPCATQVGLLAGIRIRTPSRGGMVTMTII